MYLQLSPDQLASFGSTSQLLVDESISTAATIDSSATTRDDFTATAKISEWTLFFRIVRGTMVGAVSARDDV
jgi:hypothetical protein